jgi:raffinose/stachyose/melibiose transport system permease protein
LHPEHGIEAWLNLHGITWLTVNFWGNQSVVLYSIMFVGNWQWWGFLVLLYLAAMQSIDTELYEFARIEGANRWQEFIHVTFPGIRPTFVFMILMTITWSFLIFDYVYILTNGGPNHASEVLGTYVYSKAFLGFEAGYSATIAMTMSFMCAIVIAVFVYLRRRGWEI